MVLTIVLERSSVRGRRRPRRSDSDESSDSKRCGAIDKLYLVDYNSIIMTQKVLRVGSSAAVTIPKDILRELGLRIGDRIALDFNKAKRVLVIESPKIISREDQKIARLTFRFIDRYRKDLEALAQK
ncbi:MAG: Uncharacterized protein Greene071421_290 [Parcubacteria group bacterium Greene0714_21]|nr:MAG: Uncharacterized protein Greene041639_564 [Parcubacteria group bacterium Greene0416_39]TSC97583.1 MAG: Uncharacterized protein Greene101447_437 [Parcubacteria group bacterium Greene1014_47]TSD04454.1 MAG: Uncharacterized protein Greene071421_290 [Parcubacteria group bacterium Greene0714_21]